MALRDSRIQFSNPFDYQQYVTPYLSLLVDDGNGILQLDVIEKTGEENVGDADQTVVFLLIKEWVCSTEI